MKLPVIPSKLKKIWDKWDLRFFIISSLSLQAFLLILSPSRQRSRSTLLAAAMWATYLLADWVAAVSIGQITKTIGDSSSKNSTLVEDNSFKDKNSTLQVVDNSQLYAVWASFLLIHLGGPDGITSLALEDNELWLRHLFGLAVQSLSAFYGFYLTLATSTMYGINIIVFFVGIIKFGERTWALYDASLQNFGAAVLPEPNPGPDYEDAMAEHVFNETLKTGGGGGAGIFSAESEGTGSDEMKNLDVAYSYFQTFKGLVVGFLISSKDRDLSRSYFLRQEPVRAFQLVEYELSFMYQVLHTKAEIVHSALGYVLRFISFWATLGGFWYFRLFNKKGYGRFEINVTYALFIGAIVLESFSIVKLLFSDWILMALKDSWVIKYVPKWILKRSRWSGSVSQKNMVGFCLSPTIGMKFWRPANREFYRYVRMYGVSETLKMKLCSVSYSKNVTDEAKNFIFNELKRKSTSATSLSDAMDACSQRGDSALFENTSSYIKLNWSISKYQYAESVLLWHLATELLLHDEKEDNLCFHLTRLCFCDSQCLGKENDSSETSSTIDHKRVSKLISEYMFYLLVDKPTMLAPVLGNWNIVFQDTCAEAKRYFVKCNVKRHADACKKILSVEPRVRQAAIKGNRSASILFDACKLAKQLEKVDAEKWEITSRVWVELMSYAAINCRPFVHAQQLSKGGELLTFVWLLMNHLGLGTQFAE